MTGHLIKSGFARALLLLFFCTLSGSISIGSVVARAQTPPKQAGPRRPLPKPTTGSRGFEQAGRDSSSRLIAAGATRGPLKPTAPYEGLAYNAEVFFAWTPAPGPNTYHFILREGTESSDPVIYEADVKDSHLAYPATAPALVPGKLYSWRVSMAAPLNGNLVHQ